MGAFDDLIPVERLESNATQVATPIASQSPTVTGAFDDLIPKSSPVAQTGANTSAFSDLIPAANRTPASTTSSALPPINPDEFLKSANPDALAPFVGEPFALDNPTINSAEDFGKAYTDPLITLPKPSGTGVGVGVVRGAENVVEGLTSPQNLALLGSLGGAPKVVQRIISAGFGAQMAGSAYKGAQTALDSSLPPGERAQAGTEALLGGAMSVLAFNHGIGPDRSIGTELRKSGLTPDQADALTDQLQQQKPAGGAPLPANIGDVLTKLPGDTQDRLRGIIDKHNAGQPLSTEDQAALITVRAFADRNAAEAGDTDKFTGVGKTESPPTPPTEATPEVQGTAPVPSAEGATWSNDLKQAVDNHGDEKVSTSDLGLPTEKVSSLGPTKEVDAEIPASSLILSRDELSKARLEAAGSTLKREGVRTEGVTPIDVTPSQEQPGKYVVGNDGNHRAAALLLSGERGDIPVKLMQPDDLPSPVPEKSAEGSQPKGSAAETALQSPLDQLRALQADAGEKAPVDPVAQKMASDLQKLGRVNRDPARAVASELGYYSDDERAQLRKHLGTDDSNPKTLAEAITGKKPIRETGTASSYINEPAGPEGRGHPTEPVAKEAFGEDYIGGPGAMGPREAAAMEQQLGKTSIQNAQVDIERAKRGLPERMAPMARKFGAIWQQAMRLFDINPEVGRNLVDSLDKKSRPLTDLEDAILTHEQIVRHEAYDEATENVNKAENDSERAEAQAQLAKAREDVHQVYDVGTKAGTENARGLNARKMMVREDYSLAQMENRKRAENGGTPLSQDQLQQVKEAHARIAELEKKIVEHETSKKDDLAKHYFDQLLSETKKDVKASIKSGKSVTDFISDQAAKARARIRERGPRLSAGLDPVDLVDHAIIGADYIAKGATAFADWSVKMVKDFGEKIRPYLKEIFDKSQQYHDAHESLFSKGKSKAEMTPEDIVNVAKESAANGEVLDHRTVYELARAHVRAGVDGFDNVMKAVHEDVKQAYPNVSEREVRDAFSEYGKVSFPSKEEDRVKLTEYRRIGQLQSAIDDAMKGQQPKKTGMQRNKPTQDVRGKMVELKDAMEKAGLDTRTSEAQLAGRLDAYKTRLRNGTADIQKRIAENDYTKRVPTKTPVDSEAFKLRADYEREKQKFDSQVAKDAANNRTKSQKFWDRFVGVQRAFKLTSDVVLVKLSIAAAVREVILTPAEEGVGGVVSKLLPALAAKAHREGGFSLASEMKAKAAMFTIGMRDAYKNLQMKKSNLETMYGNKRPQAPPEWYEYMGFLHAALKSPIKRAEFERSLSKRMLAASRDGVDLDNPETIRRLAQESYADANRAIFMQDNVVSKAFTLGTRAMENSKQSPYLGPALARMARFLIPIVRIPTNMVGEAATGVHGTLSGGIRAAQAYMKGIDSLPPDQADAIMRQLKKGIIGNALLLTGYFGYKNIGGFYHQGDQRKASDVKEGQYRVGGVTLPSFFSHSTGAMLLNIGATLHRVEEERAKGGGQKGFGSGALAAGSGLANQLPFMPAVTGVTSALSTEAGFTKYIHELITSTTTPAIAQHAARVIDTPGKFPENAFVPANRRNPQTALQSVEMGIPGLRKNVPAKKSARTH